MSEWISVEERLPDSDDEVLAWTTWGEAFTAICWIEGVGEKPYRSRTWVSSWRKDDLEDNPYDDLKVTHWQPLPEPPKEQS